MVELARLLLEAISHGKCYQKCTDLRLVTHIGLKIVPSVQRDEVQVASNPSSEFYEKPR
jgi:hypothetical protein